VLNILLLVAVVAVEARMVVVEALEVFVQVQVYLYLPEVLIQ
jgi:hypothetical protein